MQTFPRQTLLQRQLPVAIDLFTSNGLTTRQLDALHPLIEHFQIRVPLIGAFSSGKSSLINAFIGENLLSTDITPETAVPAEMHPAAERCFVGHLTDGSTCTLTQADVQENCLTELQPKGWLEIGLPSAQLSARPHLVLVDLPGWSSGVEAHERVIDDYADRSLAYCVVVSIEEGSLRQSLRSALQELACKKDMPIIVVFTKTEKHLPEDVLDVSKQVVDEITSLMQREPLAIATTSAHKKDVAAFATALDALEDQAEIVFESAIVSAFLHELEHVRQHLQLLANQDNKDAVRIQAEIDALAQQMQVFDLRLQRETEELDAKIGPILYAIRLRVENSLAARLDSLTSRALDGDNISDDILGTARMVIAQAIRSEFEPAMQHYLNRLEDALPSNLNIHLDLARLQTQAQTQGGAQHMQAMTTTLAPLLIKIPNPYVQAAAAVMLALGMLLSSNAEQKRQQIEEARRRERANSQVRQAIADAVQQIETQLALVLHEQVQQAQAAIARHVADERTEMQNTMETLRSTLEQGETEAAALRDKALADLQKLAALQAQLDAKP